MQSSRNVFESLCSSTASGPAVHRPQGRRLKSVHAPMLNHRLFYSLTGLLVPFVQMRVGNSRYSLMWPAFGEGRACSFRLLQVALFM